MSNSLPKILVYGANSSQGIPVVQQLLNEGYPVRVFVRDRTKADSLFSTAVEIVTGTLEDQESLKQANEGIDHVFLVLPLEFRLEVAIAQGNNVIDTARNAGVKLLVFNTSTFVPQQTTDAHAFEIKREIEKSLYRSNIPHIILRPSIYMDNLAAPWSLSSIVHQGVIAYPLPPDVKVSWISLRDTAAIAIAALKRPDLAGSIFDIGGPEKLTGEEIAEKFSKVLDRSFVYQQIPIDGFERGLKHEFGELAGIEIAKIYRWRAANSEAGITDLSPILDKLPVNLTAFEHWIKSVKWIDN